FNCGIATFDIASFFQALSDSAEQPVIELEAAEQADQGNRCLLCTRRERPRHHTAKCADKFSPPHCLPRSSDRPSYRLKPAPGKAPPMSALGQKQTYAAHMRMSAKGQ